jgi:hypothetical protein
MKIVEKIDRECCDKVEDLMVYNGKRKIPMKEGVWYEKFKFCKHCGQVWSQERRIDAAGGYESVWTAVEI